MENKKERIAIIVGVILIIGVGILTIARSIPKKVPKTTSQGEQTSEKNNPYNTINARDLSNRIDKRENLTLIDLRDAESFAAEHIMSSYNMSKDSLSFPANTQKDSPIVIIGTDNEDASINEAVSFFKKAGASNVIVLLGGYDSWKSIVGQVIGYGDPSSMIDQSKVSYISIEDAKKELSSDKTVFVDIREASLFAENHVEKAINIPFDELERRHGEIPQNKKLIICGINEIQEFQAAVKINDMLMLYPYVLKGSLTKWKEQNYPLVK